MTDGGVSIAQASRDLGVDANVLGRWKKELSEDSKHAFPGKGKLKPEDEEVRRLRREVARLHAEQSQKKIKKNRFASLTTFSVITETNGGRVVDWRLRGVESQHHDRQCAHDTSRAPRVSCLRHEPLQSTKKSMV